MQNSVLNKTVSLLSSYSDISPRPINLISYLTDFSHKDQIAKIRSIDSVDEQKRLKALLPAVTISGTFAARGEAGLICHSGLISFDIDHVTEMNQTFELLKSIPQVAYCAKSARGRGYWGIMAISNIGKHKEHFAAMQSSFKAIGIDIDTAPSNVASLRGYSYDEAAYFNHHAQIFDLVFEPPKLNKKPYQRPLGNTNDLNPFDAFNSFDDFEPLLVHHGWTPQPQLSKGTRTRYSRPGKTNGVSGDYCRERKIFYVFSTDPLTGLPAAQKGYNHVAVFNELECGGNIKTCGKKLREMGFG